MVEFERCNDADNADASCNTNNADDGADNADDANDSNAYYGTMDPASIAGSQMFSSLYFRSKSFCASRPN